MELWQAIVLSIVEGVTEFLPVSSTGHLVLTSEILKVTQTEFVKSFEISIQLGAIFSVVILYFKTLTTNIKVWSKIILGFLPTAALGFVFYDIVKSILLGNITVTLFALFFGGVTLIVLEKFYKEKEHQLGAIEDMSVRQALLIGVCQSVSIIPGVSRAAATIIGGMFLGMRRQTATEFSFLLAIPTMAAATMLDLVKTDFKFSSSEYLILGVGFVGSFVTALIVVKFLISYVRKNTFVPFGVYRIVLSILFWFFIVN